MKNLKKKMKKRKNCDLCGNKKFKKLFINKDRIYESKEKFKIVRCENCGLTFIGSELDEKELSRYYPKKEYYSLNENYIETLKLKIYETYYNKKFSSKKILFLPLKFMVRKIFLKKGGKFLDIGCGDGKFLKLIKSFGMDCYGVEPNNVENIREKMLNILNRNLKYVRFKKNFFDVISLNHVLEHLDNPTEIFKEIHRILKPNGKVIIATPNINSFSAKFFGNKWFQLDTPRHLFLYSEDTLKKYAKKEGFKIKEIKYNSTPLQILVSISYLLREFNMNKNLLKKFSTNKILFLIILPFSNLLNFLKRGDQFEAILIKK